MNMQQRRYIIKNRLEPMKREINAAIKSRSLRFQRYVSWGELVHMIKSDKLQLVKKYYHRALTKGYLTTSYDNPFGEKGAETLVNRGGIETDPKLKAREEAEWESRFKHSMDFLMLASEDTIIALLHNLENSVKEYVAEAAAHKERVYKEKEDYIKWLEEQGFNHNYQKP